MVLPIDQTSAGNRFSCQILLSCPWKWLIHGCYSNVWDQPRPGLPSNCPALLPGLLHHALLEGLGLETVCPAQNPLLSLIALYFVPSFLYKT